MEKVWIQNLPTSFPHLKKVDVNLVLILGVWFLPVALNMEKKKNGFGKKSWKISYVHFVSRKYQISYPPHRRSLEILKGCGFLKAKMLSSKCSMKLNWNFCGSGYGHFLEYHIIMCTNPNTCTKGTVINDICRSFLSAEI